MILRLTDELASALAQSGGQPLRVEDPKTQRQYLIVPEEQWPARNISGSGTGANGKWSKEKNARRFALIDKEMGGTITADEQAELNRLQQEVDAYLDRVAPLPIAAAEQLLEKLRKAANRDGPT